MQQESDRKNAFFKVNAEMVTARKIIKHAIIMHEYKHK